MSLNKSDFTSNWAYGKAKSNYHFNDDLLDKPGQYVYKAGKFQGDWSSDLATVLANSTPITWATRKGDTVSDMLTQEQADITNAGADADLVVSEKYSGNIDDLPTLKKMVDFFGLTDPEARVHVQRLGQMWNIHVDKLEDRNPDNPDSVIRFHIFLNDWSPGQFFEIGTHDLQHWKAGDIIWFDWQNAPHASANASYDPKVAIMLTGIKSAKTEQIIADATAKHIYKI